MNIAASASSTATPTMQAATMTRFRRFTGAGRSTARMATGSVAATTASSPGAADPDSQAVLLGSSVISTGGGSLAVGA
jgi:hypothetical protein